jgi:hypothetical protein
VRVHASRSRAVAGCGTDGRPDQPLPQVSEAQQGDKGVPEDGLPVLGRASLRQVGPLSLVSLPVSLGLPLLMGSRACRIHRKFYFASLAQVNLHAQ